MSAHLDQDNAADVTPSVRNLIPIGNKECAYFCHGPSYGCESVFYFSLPTFIVLV
jgi:hypothetical protein